MSKKNASKNNNEKCHEVRINIPDGALHGIDNEVLKDIITNAIIEADKQKRENEYKKREEAQKQWKTAIGLKEFPEKRGINKALRSALNRLACAIRMAFIPKNKIVGDRASIGLIRMFSQFVFRALWFLLIVVGLASIILPIYLMIIRFNISQLPINVLSIICGLALLLLSGVFRMASFEVELFEDRNYLVGIFASITSIVSIIIAIIAIVYRG